MSSIFYKDPDSKLDYKVDWSEWLATGADTIASVVWTVPVGITETETHASTTDATIWLEGGTDGEDYIIGCRITTTFGRIDERSFRIKVVSQ